MKEFHAKGILIRVIDVFHRGYPEQVQSLDSFLQDGFYDDLEKSLNECMHSYQSRTFSVTKDRLYIDDFHEMTEKEQNDNLDIYISRKLCEMISGSLKLEHNAFYGAVVAETAYTIRDILSGYADGDYAVPYYENRNKGEKKR